MAETLITLLVSEQTVPNVLFLKWFFTNHKQTVDILFVSTEKMEEKRKSLNIIEALECSNPHIANWKVIKVDENSIDDIDKKIDTKLSEWKHDSFIVSITGGTKIMSLATYAYFDEKENCQIFYQPLNQNLQKIFPEHEEYSLPDYLITIEEYMMAHGIEFKSNNTCIRDYLYNKKIYENLIQDNHNIIALMNKLQNFKKFKKKMEKGKPIDLTSLSDDFFFKSEKEPIDKYEQYEIFKLISKFDFDATAINEKEYRYIKPSSIDIPLFILSSTSLKPIYGIEYNTISDLDWTRKELQSEGTMYVKIHYQDNRNRWWLATGSKEMALLIEANGSLGCVKDSL